MMTRKNTLITKIIALAVSLFLFSTCVFAREVWTDEQAKQWIAKQKYRAGVNYIPSYAVNQIELWQKETFDIKTIDREFALMRATGFNAVRVFLSDLVFESNPDGFMERFEEFLKTADKYGIGTMVVFFTNGGTDDAKLGKQVVPSQSHNPGWKKQPSYSILGDKSKWGILEKFVKTVVGKYAKDPRVICWDIFNEPGNIKSLHIVGGAKNLSDDRIKHLKRCSLDLIRESAEWARSCDPQQPVTFGLYKYKGGEEEKIFNPLQISQSDVISYHTYAPLIDHMRIIKKIRKHTSKPIMCTEWMGRIRGSTFNPILSFHKNNNIWSFPFGFVAGKTQTWRPWPNDDTPEMQGIWFHDIYKSDHTPYCPEEVEYIKRILGK